MYFLILEMIHQAGQCFPHWLLLLSSLQGEIEISGKIDRSDGKMILCKSVVWGLQTHAGQMNLDAMMEFVWRAARSAMVTQSARIGAMSLAAAMGVCLAQTNS
jgi:hypothetical protein